MSVDIYVVPILIFNVVFFNCMTSKKSDTVYTCSADLS